MALSILLCVGVAFTPVFTSMNPGREFSSGNEIVYKISIDEDGTEGTVADGIVDKVASEMRNRLETYKIEDYSVRVEGNDMVRVSLSVNSETELNYLSRYLCFNGGNFSLAGAEEETRKTADKIFVDSEAYIVRQNDLVPYVIIPISDTQEVKTLIENVQKKSDDSSTDSKLPYRAEESDSEESATPDIYLWANWEEGDTYEIAQKDPAVTGQKIIASFVSSNIWYKEGLKDDEEPTSIQYLCGYANSDGDYDTTKLKEANMLATFITNMFNASSFEFSGKQYDVENLFVKQSSTGVTNNAIHSNATAENLLIFGSEVNIAISATLISTLVAIVIVFLILILFYRVAALGIIANNLATVFLAYVMFMTLGATFNIAAIIGGILLSASSLVISVLYMNKLKEEVYKGRALRKAHQEAMRKITLPTIDIAVISLISGLLIYLLGGNALKPLGIVLFFGAIFALLMNLIIFRINMYLLTNSTLMMDNYKLLNIDEKLVPNIMKEEKPTYVAPYENVNFTSKKKPVAIIASILALASIVTISVFGAIKGSPLNVSAANKETTQLYVSIRDDNPTLSTEKAFKDDVLAYIYVNDELISYTNVSLENRETYDYLSDITTKYTYFVTSIDSTFTSKDKFYVDLTGEKEEVENLEEAMTLKVKSIEGESSSDDYIVSEEKVSYETVVTPHQGYVALASAISIVACSLYFALRYRPSRGIASLIVTSGTTLLTYGLFVMCRIQTTAICSLVMPIATVLSLIACLVFFEKEKELFKENKNNISEEERNKLSIKASSLTATPLLISLIIIAYVAINYFGFGYKSFASIFAGMLVSAVLSALFATTLLGPTANLFSKWLKKIKLPSIKIDRAKKQRIKMQNKPKTSEPEETIFIGIND